MSAGSRITTLLPCLSRFVYLPRTAVDDLFGSDFFIDSSFGRSRGPRADNSNYAVLLIMNHKDEAKRGRSSEVHYKLEGFSMERLMHFATALEHDVVIEIRPREEAAKKGRILIFGAA